MPGVVRYVIDLPPDVSGRGTELAYDGFAEVWFESLEAMRASAGAPETRAVLEDEPNLFDLTTVFRVTVEEQVIVE